MITGSRGKVLTGVMALGLVLAGATVPLTAAADVLDAPSEEATEPTEEATEPTVETSSEPAAVEEPTAPTTESSTVAPPAVQEATEQPAADETTDADAAADGPVILLTPDPTNTIAIDKTNTADGEPASDGGTVQPGDSYTYNFTASCSSIEVDCVNLTVVDTFPGSVVVDESTIPTSIPGFRDVTWDGSTLTVVYTETLANPPGATGKIAGTSDSFEVSVTLPADTPLESGTAIPNEATISADNVEESATDPSPVIVDVPRVVDVEASKSFSDPTAIGGDPEASTTIVLGADNLSSSSAEVTEMTIEDSTAQTWEYLDVESVTVTQYPAGADQAQLFVCPSANAPCDSDDDYVAGGTGTPPGPSSLTFPAGAPAADAVGVRVVFTDTDGSFIEPVAGGGTSTVEIEADLRETVRSTGQPIEEIPETTTIDNTTTATVTDPLADPDTATDDASAEFQILPPTLILEPTKTFYPDENGNFQTDAGEHAVIGENSGVSMNIGVVNASAFPIAEIVVTEPGEAPPDTEFDKVDATSLRLTFPAGAANANVVVTYDNGTSTNTDYTAPGPGTIDLGEPPPRVTSITVTYTGPDDDGDGLPDPTIEPGATASLDVHGNLNDLVDESDVGGAVDNCADVEGSGGGVPGTTGTFVGSVCAQLPIEARDPGTGGEKTASQTTIPPDQPILFTLSTSNNGNLPLFDVVVADPALGPDGTPPLTDTFRFLRFLDAQIANDDVAADITLEVYVLGTGWMAYPGPSEAQLALVTGVRATVPVLAPTESFDLLVGMQLRYWADPGATIQNCYAVTANDSTGAQVIDTDHCAPPLAPANPEQAATLNKAITPSTVPRRIPGMDPADSAATVQLRVQNTGSLTAQYLQVTDEDADFWDAVDLASLGDITPPATGVSSRADLIQIDALVDGEWVEGTPGPIASAALPPGVSNDQVRGLRFTFSSTLTVNDGYVITPCNEDPAGGCAGVVEFVVEPRLALLSTGEPLPETLEDTATGAFATQLAPEGTEIPPVTDDLTFVPGDPQLDVNKTPESATLQPGQIGTFTLLTTNNGTANLPDLTVSDPVPDGLEFDDGFADPDTGEPYTVTWTNLPDGYPEPPTAVFEVTPDPEDPTRVGLLRWTFAGWDMPPNASVSIFFRYTLQPGVQAGQLITNTMGASSPVEDLACTDPDVVVTDGPFGEGTYCTDPAQVTVTAGASFASRKWVAGNPDLGWFNQSTGELVPVGGGGGCLSLEANDRIYTTNPCIALVNPGEEFHYVLRVENAGTEDGLRMVIVDTFPAPGDTGVLGAPRGTEWSTAPTLAGPATYAGPTTGEIGYTSGTACTDDLFLNGPPCPAGSWDDEPGPSTTALRLDATFAPEALPPGGVVDVYFSMQAPADVPRVSDPTVAYNSIAHAEITEIAPGDERVLPPLEPLKVGVAVMYGTLEVVKEIGDNPAELALDDVEFTFTYSCTLSNGSPSVSGTVTATPTEPGLVEGIPAGATCEVWESGTNGGVPSATEADPVEVVIEPSLDLEVPVISSVTVTNDFPLREVSLLKTVAGDAEPQFTDGPYPTSVNCEFLGATLPGYPLLVELFSDEPVTTQVPVGTECTVVEQDVPAAVTVTYDPPNEDGTAGVVTVPAEADAAVSVGVTNTFATGSLVVTKLVSGPGAPEFSGGPFTFGVSCDYLDETDVYAVVVVVPGSDDGSPVRSEPVTGLPVGAVCTVTEIDDGGADVTPDPVTVAIEADEEAEAVMVSFTNPFSAGTVAIAKTVDGDAAGSEYVADLEFTLQVQCALDTEAGRITVLDAEVTIAGDGVPVPVTSADGSPALVPAGAHCWAVETSSGGATAVTIDHDSYETGAVVVADPETEAPQEILISATNTFESAALTVTKLVVGDADPGADYLFSVDCTIPDADGTIIDVPPLNGATSARLGAGDSVAIEVLVGATCQVVELDIPDGVTLTFATTGGVDDDDTTDGIVIVGPDGASVVATNTYPDRAPLPPTGTPAPATLLMLSCLLISGGALIRRSAGRSRPTS